MALKPLADIASILQLIVSVIMLLVFLIFIVVVVSTVIPQLYQIDEGTDHIKHVEDGTDHIKHVEDGVDLLHEDLTTIIGQLNLAAGLLISMDQNIANLCNGESCSAYVINTY